VAEFEVVVGDAFAEVVEQEFLEGLGVELSGPGHFGGVAGAFGLDDDPHGGAGTVAVVDHQVVAALGVDVVVGGEAEGVQEVRDEVFVELLGFAGGDALQQGAQGRLKALHRPTGGAEFEKGFVEGLFGRERLHGWGIRSGAGRKVKCGVTSGE
jgi:hypothetical protein